MLCLNTQIALPFTAVASMQFIFQYLALLAMGLGPAADSTVMNSIPGVVDVSLDGDGRVLYVSNVLHAVYALSRDGSIQTAGSGVIEADGVGESATLLSVLPAILHATLHT
jgi:hypothetical protein